MLASSQRVKTTSTLTRSLSTNSCSSTIPWTYPTSRTGHPPLGRSPLLTLKSTLSTTISARNGTRMYAPAVEKTPIPSQTQGTMKSTTIASSCTTRRSLSTGGCVTEYHLSLHYDNYSHF